MSNQFTCDDKDTLIAYLYGEIDAASRRAVDQHLASCAACAAEVAGLGDVRAELGAWAAPDAELGFTIVKKSDVPSNVLRPARWWNTVPVWAQAAAAVLVLAAGASIANLQIKSGADGFTVTTGWMHASDAATLVAAPSNDQSWKPALASLEQQLRNEIRTARDQDVRVASRGGSDEATVKRVQQMITDSEQRHAQELAARLIAFQRDMNMQRRADLMQITSSFGDYDRRLLQQRQMLNNAIRISNPQ